MTDKDDSKAGKKLQLSSSIEAGKIRQNINSGRAKTVMVEVKRGRNTTRSKPAATSSTPSPSPTSKTDTGTGSLTNQEREARLRALEKANEESKRTRDLPPPVVQEKKMPPPPPPSAPKELIEEQAPVPKDSVKKPAAKPHVKKDTAEQEEKKRPAKVKIRDEKRTKSKLTISNIYEHEHAEERMRSLASVKRARQKAKRQQNDGSEGSSSIREIIVPETITVQELANRMAVRLQDVVGALMKMGEMKMAGDEIDADTAELIIQDFGHKVKRVTDADVEEVLVQSEPDEADLESRPAVVTIMGHVDHGKTSLLDALRQTNVTGGEAGGITQHIGAYQITHNDQKITFLDTPGHAAFTAMRKRGAHVTDIVILVVAADDGIMPQTIEAINHSKAAGVPIIVAINKMDKPEADPSRVKNELLSHELVSEDFGGDIQCVEVSAKSKLNLDGLIDAVLLQSEMLELTASPHLRGEGSVIEARLDKAKGIVATLLVQRGTLRTGDIVVAGTGYGRVKNMSDENGKSAAEAGPATPVEVLGLDRAPQAGDTFAVAQTEKDARDVVEYRERMIRDQKSDIANKNSIEQLFQAAQDGTKELRMIVKADVQGSAEAIIGSLEKLSNDEVKVKFVHNAVGGITESDVQLASATGSIIVAFNVRAASNVKQLAETENVDINYYSIIYNLIDDTKAMVGGLMKPVVREEFIGIAEIREIFKMSKYGKVAGCMVKDGIVKRGAGVRLIRDDVVIHEGKLKTLRRFKDDVNEVKEGYECGMAFENYEDMKDGDMIEAFEVIEEARVLD